MQAVKKIKSLYMTYLCTKGKIPFCWAAKHAWAEIVEGVARPWSYKKNGLAKVLD